MNACDISDSLRIQSGVACEECGSTARVGRGFCLNCMLRCAFDCEAETKHTLNEALDEVDVRDADWRIGNYQILEEIGRGGMGVIYRARQRHSHRIVALKRILSYQAESQVTLVRFRREAQAAASLDHPNILPIYEVSEGEDGLPFFSMKLATGGSLLDETRSLRTDPRRIVALMAKVTRAVHYAHVQGILHRDLKPGNILLDGRGEPMVSDFGLAKWLDTSSDLTRTLMIFGTPGYIAPEQAHGAAKNLTPAADVYSIGAVLFDLFTGRTPFLGEHALAVIKQAVDKPAPKLRTLAPLADRDLETICGKCLEREPQARYRSAGDVAEDLERWLEGRPIVARPVSPPVRIWRWSKRNPKLATAAAVSAALAILASIALLSSSQLREVVRGEATAAKSVGMLPFEDLDDASFNSGKAIKFTDDLRARLSKEKEIGLSLATEEKQGTFDLWKQEEWHDLATHLSVRNLLSGTIRTRQGKSRAVVQLLDGVTGTAIRRWLFDAESEDVIANDIANSVATTMHSRANHEQLPRTKNEIPDVDFVAATTNSNAKNYYVAARELRSRLNVADFDKSIALFEKAIEEDPNYGAAYAMLASACQARSELDPSGPWLEKGNRAAENAIRFAPMLSEAQRAYAGTFRYRGQFKQALEAYLSAFELDQTSDRAAATVGNAVADLGRPDLALKWYEKARRREPRPGLYSEYIGDALSELGETSRAESAFRDAIIFRPDLPGATIGLGRLAVFRGDFESARRLCRDAQSQFSNDWELQVFAAEIEFFAHNYEAAAPLYQKLIAKRRNGEADFSGAIRFLSALGFMYSVAAQPSQGQSLLVEAKSYDLQELKVAPDNPRLLYSLAATEAALNQSDSALEKLQNAIDNGWTDHRSLSRDPRFDAIRDSPRFKEIYIHLRNKMESMDATMAGRNGGRQ